MSTLGSNTLSWTHTSAICAICPRYCRVVWDRRVRRPDTDLTKREREMFYLTTLSTHFIYGYMASYIWLRTILILRKETRCRHIGYHYRLTARVILYAPSHRQDNTYHGLCYTSRGALAGARNSSMGPLHEGSIRRPTAPWANALPLSYVPLPDLTKSTSPCRPHIPTDYIALKLVFTNLNVGKILLEISKVFQVIPWVFICIHLNYEGRK